MVEHGVRTPIIVMVLLKTTHERANDPARQDRCLDSSGLQHAAFDTLRDGVVSINVCSSAKQLIGWTAFRSKLNAALLDAAVAPCAVSTLLGPRTVLVLGLELRTLVEQKLRQRHVGISRCHMQWRHSSVEGLARSRVGGSPLNVCRNCDVRPKRHTKEASENQG